MGTVHSDIVCVFSMDNAYCQHLAVAIASLLANNPDCRFSAHIIYHDVEQDNLEKLRRFLDGIEAMEVHFHHFDASRYNFKITLHLSAAAYFRLFLAEIIPANIGKVLYLDSDLVVLGSVRHLWETPMEDASVAAVVDPSANKPGFLSVFGQVGRTMNEQLGLPDDYAYFNSGVLLVNLDAWRAKNLNQRFVNYLDAHSDLLLYQDQDVLNAVLYDDVIYLGYEWNFQAKTSRADAALINLTPEAFREIQLAPKIVHFAGGDKPWKYKRKVPFESEYFKYLKMTPWKGYVQPDRNLKGFLGRYLSPIRQALKV